MIAVDTNVLIYRLDRRDPTKFAKARDLLRHLRSKGGRPILLWQVIVELLRQLRTWQDQGQLSRAAVLRYVAVFRRILTVTMPTPAVLDAALDLAGRFSLSHWDSMILGACKEAGVTTFYTEDMGAPTSYDGIQLINPFI
ncbi:MAG: PIN domain-containing protein [Gemmataceae bacterium]|nr:PIN domain-containing protein [Gemmataceae bacterium]